MRRLLPLVLLAALVLAGCGSAESGGGGGSAPAPADLAADAVAALEEAGSAHYVFDADVDGAGSVHAEGDGSADAFTAEGSVTFQGVTFSGQILASRSELFIKLMDRWYGDAELGLEDAADEAPSPDEVREYFDDLFTGSVGEGPEIDGVATWRFEGKLNADGLADLSERFEGDDVSEEDLELLRDAAETSRFVLDVGREGGLPRHLSFTMNVPVPDLTGIGGFPGGSFSVTMDLSEFGKDVSYEAPADYRPLEDLFEELFGSFG
jgi:hypothetical protein